VYFVRLDVSNMAEVVCAHLFLGEQHSTLVAGSAFQRPSTNY
jgi:hypothetical protein